MKNDPSYHTYYPLNIIINLVYIIEIYEYSLVIRQARKSHRSLKLPFITCTYCIRNAYNDDVPLPGKKIPSHGI